MSVREGGRESVTHYRVLKRYRAHTYISVGNWRPAATHQIRRCHLAPHQVSAGGGTRSTAGASARPRKCQPFAAGDSCAPSIARRCNAQKLGLTHPVSGEALHWESCRPPADFQALLGGPGKEDLTHAGWTSSGQNWAGAEAAVRSLSTTRKGRRGASGPYASLNLGEHVGDEPKARSGQPGTAPSFPWTARWPRLACSRCMECG